MQQEIGRRAVPEELKRCGSYQIRNIVTGQVYVGGTGASFYKRRKHHRGYLVNGLHHNKQLQTDWNTHGASIFVFEILEVTSKDRRDVLAAEQRAIDSSAFLYNAHLIAGSPRGWNQTAESIEKTASKLRGMKKSPEQAERLRTLQVGRTASPETRAKMSASRTGKTQSLETRMKQSESRRRNRIEKEASQ